MTVLRRTISAAALLTVLLTSCAPPPALVPDTARTPAPELLRRVRSDGERLHTLSGKGSIAFESPELSGSAFFTVAMRRPDSLLLTLEGFLGMDLGFLFVGGDRFVLYNTLENKVIEGPATSSGLRTLVPIDITPRNFIDALVGRYVAGLEDGQLMEYRIDDGLFHVTVREGNGTVQGWIDPASLLVARYTRQDSTGSPLVDAETGSYVERDGVFAPRRITLAFPRSGRQVSVTYNTLTVNDPEPEFSFVVPSSARRSKVPR